MMTTNHSKKTALAALAGVALLCGAETARAEVPATIPVQGVLTDAAGVPVEGDQTVQFTLYDADTGGSELWVEQQTLRTDVGLFTAYLGSVTALDTAIFDGQDLWLGVKVGSDAEMTPRLQIASVPYAIAAGSASSLGELAPGDVALASHTHAASDITSGTLSDDRFSCYGDLGAEGRLDNDSGGDLLTRQQADARYRNASNINSGTLNTAFYSAYNDLTSEGRLNNNSSADLLTRGQADARYVNGSSTQIFAALPAGQNQTFTMPAGSSWEFCALTRVKTMHRGSCRVRRDSSGDWELIAEGADVTSSSAFCEMRCLDLN